VTVLLGLAIRSTVMLAAGLLLCAALRRHSAALRHRVLAASLLAAALVLPLSLMLPSWRFSLPAGLVDPAPARSLSPAELLVEFPRHAAPAAGASSNPRGLARVGAPAGRSRSEVLLLVWLTGSFFTAGTLVVSLLRVRRAVRRGVRVEDPRWVATLETVAADLGVTREITISRTDSPDLLGTWGMVKPEVLLPRDSHDWDLERVRVVLSHELAHIRRHDWLVQMGADVIRAWLWFNPLVWIVCQRLRRESEQACDDEVLGLGVEARDYAAHLLELARQCRRPGSRWASAIPMTHPSTLEKRITAMLNPLLDRRIPSARSVAGLAALLLAVSLPIAALRAGPPAPMPLLGTIYDATGAVIPGAQVALIDATETKWTATSKANGRFELPAVGAGKYVLDVKLPGFRALRQEFELSQPRDWERAVTLQIGVLSETVQISANRAILPKQLKPSSSDSERVRVGGSIRAPKKEVHIAPVYPPAMIAAGLSGVVPVEAIIGVDGTVSSVRVLSAQVHPDFAMAAVDAVRQWRFTPTLLNDVPVEVAMTVTLRFQLAE